MSERVKPNIPWIVKHSHQMDAFYRSTILRVVDEEIDKWETVLSDGQQPHRWDDAAVALDVLDNIRARFEEADDE